MIVDLDFIKLLWQSELFFANKVEFSPSANVKIIDRGVVVEGAEADFSGAVLSISGVEISGGVKVDLKSSHWREAGDLTDPKYDNVVLHLVLEQDVQLLRRGRPVLTCVIEPNQELLQYYDRMKVDCDTAFERMDQVERDDILTRLLDERIERKAKDIIEIIEQQKGSWHEASYICFMRALASASEQKDDFVNIAKSLPYQKILLHSDRPQLVEALMLGQAGHLDVEYPDFYIERLQREFVATRSETGMLPALINWKPVRLRPYSSLPLTLVRAAAILCDKENIFEEILEFDDINDLRSLFIVDVPSYWQWHSAPMKGEGKVYGSFTRDRADLLIINFVIPMLLAHAKLNSDEELVERALRFYEELPAERNTYTRRWSGRNWRPIKAYDSQALVQLGAEYCKPGRCALCPIGRHQLLRHYLTTRG